MSEDLPLAVFVSGPVASLVGAMIFPNDKEKAEIYAAHWVATTLAQNPEAVRGLSVEDHQYLYAKVTKYGVIHEEASREAVRGTKCGALVAYLWRANAGTSWNDAVAAAEHLIGKANSKARSSYLSSTADFRTVLHYWGVLQNDYRANWPRDFRLFISRATILLQQMRQREANRDLGGETFSTPKVFVPTEAFDWRVAGHMCRAALPDSLAPKPKSSGGRPRKPQS